MPALFPFQQRGAAFLAERRAAILGDAMGLGKTVQAIEATRIVNARRVLVLCPNISVTNWRREFAQWRQGDDVDLTVLGHATLAASARRAADLLAADPFDVLIVDEAHAYKDPQARRTQRLYGLRCSGVNSLAARAQRVWLLSGTLMPNHAGELYPHLRALFPSLPVVRGQSYWHFVERFCVVAQTPFGQQISGTRNGAELAAALRPVFLRRKGEDVLGDMPPITWQTRTVDPRAVPPRDEAAEALLRAAAAKGDSDEALKELRAIAFSDHVARLRQAFGLAKAPAVAEIVNDLQAAGEQVLVFGAHVAPMAEIAKATGGALLVGDTAAGERQRMVDAFQAGEARVLVANLSIASTALTLTAARHVVFAETSWVPADLQQAAKRCHRIGQTRPVIAAIVSLAGSLDEQVNGVLVRKARDAKEFDALITEKAA
jgi:SWI/SNF-related matrix-associated actin-dependent regulator 1 of chromatin subfamily A